MWIAEDTLGRKVLWWYTRHLGIRMGRKGAKQPSQSELSLPRPRQGVKGYLASGQLVGHSQARGCCKSQGRGPKYDLSMIWQIMVKYLGMIWYELWQSSCFICMKPWVKMDRTLGTVLNEIRIEWQWLNGFANMWKITKAMSWWKKPSKISESMLVT